MVPNRTYGNMMLLGAAAIWGVAFVPQRVAMSSIDPHWFNALRFSFGALMLFLLTRNRKELFNTSLLVHSLPLGICLFLGSLCQQIALIATPAGKAGFVTSLYFVLVPFVEFLVYRRIVRMSQWLATFLAVCGITLLCGNDVKQFSSHDLVLLLCTVPFAFHVVFASRVPMQHDALGIAFQQYVFCGLFGILSASLLEPPPLFAWPSSLILSFLYCSVLSVAIGYTCQIVGQKHTSSIEAALLFSLEAVFAGISGTILLGETLSLIQISGCSLMLLSVVLVQIPVQRLRARLVKS